MYNLIVLTVTVQIAPVGHSISITQDVLRIVVVVCLVLDKCVRFICEELAVSGCGCGDMSAATRQVVANKTRNDKSSCPHDIYI